MNDWGWEERRTYVTVEETVRHEIEVSKRAEPTGPASMPCVFLASDYQAEPTGAIEAGLGAFTT